jgi:hypothetical protein
MTGKQLYLLMFSILLLGMGKTLIADDALQKGLVFYAPLDSTPDAALAEGTKSPRIAKNLNFADGKFGKGVEIKGDAQLYYHGGKNIDLSKGTVAMWIKRYVDWKASPCVFFKSVAGSNWNHNSLYMVITEWSQIRVWVWDDNKNQTLIMSPNNVPQKADTWYHLAVTFTDGAVKIYVDGKEISYGTPCDPMVVMPKGSPGVIQFGSDYTPEQVVNGVLDELRIYNRVLSAEEVALLVGYKPE